MECDAGRARGHSLSSVSVGGLGHPKRRRAGLREEVDLVADRVDGVAPRDTVRRRRVHRLPGEGVGHDARGADAADGLRHDFRNTRAVISALDVPLRGAAADLPRGNAGPTALAENGQEHSHPNVLRLSPHRGAIMRLVYAKRMPTPAPIATQANMTQRTEAIFIVLFWFALEPFRMTTSTTINTTVNINATIEIRINVFIPVSPSIPIHRCSDFC